MGNARRTRARTGRTQACAGKSTASAQTARRGMRCWVALGGGQRSRADRASGARFQPQHALNRVRTGTDARLQGSFTDALQQQGQRLQITIDDDGPGIAPERRAAALTRGVRLDESAPGSGLGLHIVAALSALYGGSVELGDSPLGGLRVRLKLPATPRPA